MGLAMVLSGPTQGAERHTTSVGRWKSHPWLARFLRASILLLPVVVAVGFTWLAGRLLPPERVGLGRWVWMGLVFVLANFVLAALRRVTRRLTPLVALMKLTLVFPDQAPSRTKATLRKSNSRTLLRQMEEARARGETTGAALHGDYLVQLLKDLNDHDRLTRGHSERVRAYAEMLGEELRLGEDDMNKLRWSALLHDAGKLEVPHEILNKDGLPTDDEWLILSGHPAAGGRLLEPLRPWLGDWVHSADQHHCRWDGNGYPEKLAGTDIAFSGRLVAVADAYDVMTSPRSYKKSLGPEIARQELTDCAGAQFDPTMVRAFLNISLGRLRTVAGPLAWFANLLGTAQVPVPIATTITAAGGSALVASAGLAVASLSGLVPAGDPAPTPVARIVETVTVIADDIEVTGLEDEPIEITLTAEGGVGDVTFRVGTPAHGSVVLGSTVSIESKTGTAEPIGDHWELTGTYVPHPDFFGEDEFTLEACDSIGQCAPAVARVLVESANDAPVAGDDIGIGFTTSEDVVSFTTAYVTGNDSDVDDPVDPATITVVTSTSNGTLVDNGDGTFDYTPDPEWFGIDPFHLHRHRHQLSHLECGHRHHHRHIRKRRPGGR